MKILSWNILAHEFIKKRYYPMVPPEIILNRKHRETQIVNIIKHMDMDVMLLQEVMESYNALTHSLQKTHYLVRGQYIKWQGKQSYSGNVILLRKSGLPKRCVISKCRVPIAAMILTAKATEPGTHPLARAFDKSTAERQKKSRSN